MTDIVFEALTDYSETEAASVPVRLAGAYGTNATNIGSVGVRLPGVVADGSAIMAAIQAITAGVFGTDASAFGAVPVRMAGALASTYSAPDVAVGTVAVILAGASGDGEAPTVLDASVKVPVAGAFGTDAQAIGMVGVALARARGTNADPMAGGIFYALRYLGYVSMLAGVPFYGIADEATFGDSLVLSGGFALDDVVIGDDLIDVPAASRRMAVGDALQAIDLLSTITWVILSDSGALTDSVDLTLAILLTMTDVLLGTDDLLTRRDALMAISIAAALSDSAQPITNVSIADTFDAQSVLVQRANRIAAMVDAAAIADTLNPSLSIVMAFNEALQAVDTLSALRAALLRVDDALIAGGRFVFDGIAYTIFAMQPVNAAMSEYENLQYESMTTIDGKLYGVNENGVFEEGGESDVVGFDGDTPLTAPIRGSVYGGLSNFGTSLLKAVPAVYVGMQRSGQMLLKVVSIRKGVRKENWYKLSDKPMAGTANARFKPSSGIHAEYLGFELANIDGEDFDTDFVNAWIMQLNRRI